MKLFLTSSTITPNLITEFEEFIGRPSKGLNAAFIPDAGYALPGDTSWIDQERQDVIDQLNWNVTEVKLKDETPETITKLFDYDLVFVNGGFSGHLANEMRRSGFAVILSELLAKGIIYVGSSAGSMVLSDEQDASSWYLGEPEPEAANIPGLGVIDFQFYPVHKHREYPEIMADIQKHLKPGLTYYIVKDGSAISIDRNGIKLHGSGITKLP